MDAINNSDKLGRVARNLGLLGNALGIGTAGFNLGNEYFNPSSSNNLVQGAMLTQSAGELWYTGMNTAYSVTPLAPSVMIVDVADIAGTWVGAPDFAETAGNTIAIGTLSVLPETQQTVFNAIGHEMRTGDSPLSWSVRRLDATRANATGRSFLR